MNESGQYDCCLYKRRRLRERQSEWGDHVEIRGDAK